MHFSTSTIAKAALTVALISQVAALPTLQTPPAELEARAATHHKSRPSDDDGQQPGVRNGEPSKPTDLWQHVSFPKHDLAHPGAELRARAPARSPKAPKKPSSDPPSSRDIGDCSTGLCGPRRGTPSEVSPEVKEMVRKMRDCKTGLCGRSDEAAAELRARSPARKAPKKPKKPKTPSSDLPSFRDVGDCATGLCGPRGGAPSEPSPEVKKMLWKTGDCVTGLCGPVSGGSL